RTSYHPDCDYVDGEVQERNWGEFDHAASQGFVGSWFCQHRQEWQLHVLLELRIRVSAARVRIADVCLVSRSQPIEQVLTTPPLAVIEILSPEDRISRYGERLGDYRRMGIQNVWVIDPAIEWVTTAARQRGCRAKNSACAILPYFFGSPICGAN